jgi:hypothetical protein
MNKQRFVPIEEARVSPGGFVQHYKNHWWIHVPGKGLMFSGQRGEAPQCNSDRRVAEIIHNKLYPDTELVQIADVYVKDSPNSY